MLFQVENNIVIISIPKKLTYLRLEGHYLFTFNVTFLTFCIVVQPAVAN